MGKESDTIRKTVLGRSWQENEEAFAAAIGREHLVSQLIWFADHLRGIDVLILEALGEWALISKDLPNDIETLQKARQEIQNMLRTIDGPQKTDVG